MPATYQGTHFSSGSNPILNLAPPTGLGGDRQKAKLELIGELNGIHHQQRPGDTELTARQAAYELAFRMQASAPDAVDLSQESEKTKEMYGLNRKETAGVRSPLPPGPPAGRARRAVRAGVLRGRQPVGRARRHRREPHEDVPAGRPAVRGADPRPEAARAARRHAGDLGRRVRPHPDDRGRERPRPQPLRLLDAHGRRRGESAASSLARRTSSG
jgi:hypothetical protein